MVLPRGLATPLCVAMVVLAPLGLAGCANGQSRSASPEAAQSAPTKALEAFSPEEQARILAVQEIVEQASAEHQLDPSLVNAIIWVESRFDVQAKSPAGARGLMQLMPSTAAYLAKRMGEPRPRASDPEFNVRAGCLYLSEMIRKFGDERAAVAAYHAGPGNVAKWTAAGTEFPEYSQTYVAKVMEARERFEGVHGLPSRRRAASASELPVSKPAPAVVAATSDEVDDDGDPLVAPDPAGLPDAATIHGIGSSNEQTNANELAAAEPGVEPLKDRFNTMPIELEPPVFEPHPELDNTREPPPGWTGSGPPEPAPTRRPSTASQTSAASAASAQARKQRPRTSTDSDEGPEPELGLGVLPDL